LEFGIEWHLISYQTKMNLDLCYECMLWVRSVASD
jgi:hypothetical protein